MVSNAIRSSSSRSRTASLAHPLGVSARSAVPSRYSGSSTARTGVCAHSSSRRNGNPVAASSSSAAARAAGPGASNATPATRPRYNLRNRST